MFFSKSTGGFYTVDIHGSNMPADKVEITDEKYQELMHGQQNGMTITADDSGYPILKPLTFTYNYADMRRDSYPPFADYLDGIVKGDQEQINAYIEACKAVKLKYPKS